MSTIFINGVTEALVFIKIYITLNPFCGRASPLTSKIVWRETSKKKQVGCNLPSYWLNNDQGLPDFTTKKSNAHLLPQSSP